MKKLLTIFLLVMFAFSNVVWAGTTGKLAGKVIDAKTKEALPFVNVIIEGTKLGASTDLDGNYVILNIPPGNYKIRVQYVGYQTVLMENVSIQIDLTTTKDFELSESSLELETVVVQGTSGTIQKDVTSSQSSISSDEINALPVAELSDVLQLQAGVTRDAGGGFHIRGGRSSEISYWVNGVSVTDAYDNSQGIEIDNSSVQELQVISGTFNAEYGNAMSGIINTVTKEGGSDYHGDIKVYASDHVSNFTSYFPHINKIDPIASHNLQGSLSGPIPFTNNALSFFANLRYNYDDGYLYGERKYLPTGQPGDGKVVSMNWSRRYIGQVNLSYWPVQALKINAEGLYSKEDWQDYDHAFRYNPEGNVNKFANSYNTTLTATHMLSSSTFYTIKGSYFFKDFNEYLYKNPYDSRYLHPDSLNTVSYAFRTKGTNLHRFFRETNTIVGKLDFTSQVTENHLLKGGVETRIHRLQLDDYNLQPAVDPNTGAALTNFVPEIPGPNTPNRTNYTNKPFELSGYVQDKIEFLNVIINLGLRFDYFDAKGKVIVDPSDPNIFITLRRELENLTYEQKLPYYYKDSKPKYQFSPRFGIAYPISDQGVVHFSYGQFLQIPSFQYLFNRGNYYVPETGSGYGVYGNPDLEPQRTTMYEIGFRQEFGNIFHTDVTGFYRDVRNWITAGPLVETLNGVTYSSYINKDYSNVKGITLTFNKRYDNYYSFDINYTYQVAEGSNSNPDEEFFAAQGNAEPTLFLIPMEWDQRHLFNASLYVGQEDWGVSFIGRYGTGLPYTPAITQYTSDRGISSGLQRNSRRRPNQFIIDLKLNKLFNVAGINVNTFLQIFNLLDTKIVVNVFGDTGRPDFTTEGQNVGEDAARPNTVAEYLRYPWNYGEPRLVQFGFEFSF
ncbi:MAG TPA: TonB-dependent receptor [Ignavibacteriaceae bacterium]|nr:TonB-dependent receptor [Ignavibacteriaceae bacterium]